MMFTESQFANPVVRSALPDSRSLQIGDVAFTLTSASSELVAVTPELIPFVSDCEKADIHVRVNWADRLFRGNAEIAFDSGAVWTLFRKGKDLVIDCEVPALGSGPYKRMRVNADFQRVEVLLNRRLLGRYQDVCALDYPSDELLITNYLAHYGLGVEVHGCGLVDSESGGHLLLGHSGAGKSTTARLWQSLRNPEILSDDRIILRLQNGELWMYGTPWHGEGRFASPGKARVNKILVLQHGGRNQFVELSRSQAAGELFARCFPPFHSSVGLQGVVEFLERLVNTVPCYEFRFAPNVSAVEAVIEMDYATVH